MSPVNEQFNADEYVRVFTAGDVVVTRHARCSLWEDKQSNHKHNSLPIFIDEGDIFLCIQVVEHEMQVLHPTCGLRWICLNTNKNIEVLDDNT